MALARLKFVAAIFAVIGFFTVHEAAADDATPVRAASVRQVNWQNSLQIVANIQAWQDASLAAQRPGQIVAVLYNSGQNVAAGTLLVQLNDAPEQAQLALDEARQAQARAALMRAEKLMTINGASKAALEQAQADAAEDAAQVTADQAMVAEQKIIAPFAGSLGIRNVSAGDYVNQGQVVARVTQNLPLRVLFSIPETQAPDVAIGAGFTVLAPGSAAAGHVSALSPVIDGTTDARAAEGVLDHGDAAFVPGGFATISLMTGAPVPALAVPVTALNDSLLGPYVFVIQPHGGGDILRTAYVTPLGAQGQDEVIAAKGLQAGDQVVAIGGFKLTDGADVKVSP